MTEEQLSELNESIYNVQHDLSVVQGDITQIAIQQKTIIETLDKIFRCMGNPARVQTEIKTQTLRDAQGRAKDFTCPVSGCKSHMVGRMAKHGGQAFLGCSRYPECHGSRSMDGKDTTKRAKNTHPAAWNTSLADAKSAPGEPDPHTFDLDGDGYY